MNSFLVLFSIVTIIQAVPLQQTSDKQQTYSNVNGISSSDKTVSTYVPAKTEENSEKDAQYTAAASQILENPSYDPNVYSTFLPHDAIQQYVNQYGAPYPAASYFPVPGAYAVQTGYEGYLVPSEIVPEPSIYSNAITFVRGLLPRSIVGWLFKGAVYVLSAIAIVLFGGGLTTAICTLTPLCTISFATIPFLQLRNSAKVVGKALGAEITPERIQRTAELVQSAIEKFSQMQNSEEHNNSNQNQNKNMNQKSHVD